ncbi:MAG: type II toxin-antitoxin system RelE/ParE family toxin [Bacteroidota bacterium]|nr:type II toxin-antitoxin system RelE/ParE family toxin [Bacteroidota bacterium]
MSEKLPREIYYYKDYYLKFFSKQSPEIQKKINWTLELLLQLDRIPKKFFKHITGAAEGLYEIRIEYGSNHFRILCFFDDGNLIILVNSFQKQSMKIPTRELKLAAKLKKQYFDEKGK